MFSARCNTISTTSRLWNTLSHGSSRCLSGISTAKQGVTLLQDKNDGFGFVRSNPRPAKPRTKGVTEIRGPYYTVMGKRYLADVLETMGSYIDGLKFAGGSFSLFQEQPLRDMIELSHEHNVYVSTGGWAEHLLTHPDVNSIFDRYLQKCKNLGFDVIELSSGFLSLPPDDWLRLVDKVHSYKLTAKPELGIQFGAGGDTPAAGLEALGTSDAGKLVDLGHRFLNAGVERLMIESEGITENVTSWRTDVVSQVMQKLPPERVMFEAADPKVFNWYIREFGIDVNLFVDHSQIVQLSCLRSGIWGTADTFGKVVSFRPDTIPGARLRCRQACDSCKRRKQKCNGEQPCAICVQRNKASECHFSDKPARLLKPDHGLKETAGLLSESMEGHSTTVQGETAMDRLLNALEDQGMATLDQSSRGGDKDGAAPVPKVSRLLRDGQGKFMYVGDSASLSFLQSVRRIVASSIGSCGFTEDNLRHSMLEAFPMAPTAQPGGLVPPPAREDARALAHQYVLATSPLLDLFDLNEFYPRLADWVENPTGNEELVSSIFYLVLAIGAQVSSTDQTLAEQYFVSGRHLAYAAFTETPSQYTIQSYILISMYMLGACRRNGAFMNLGIALRAAYAVGIHRKDANALFCTRERIARERVWRSLRMLDLFLSASLGRPPGTSDFDYDQREDPSAQVPAQQHSSSDEHVAAAVVALCRIFERILSDVYMKQVVSISVAETISNQHRQWVLRLPDFLKAQSEGVDAQQLEGALSVAHIFGSYYWSIILLTRPFFIYRVSRYAKGKSHSQSGASSAISTPDALAGNSRVSLFADACVYSALRGLEVVNGLTRFPSLPRRLPFLINSVFNSAVVLGAAFFADYDSLLPLEDGLTKAERFLAIFAPHDPHARRFIQIVEYLRGAVTEYVRCRNAQWMARRSHQVDQLFGQVGSAKDVPPLDLAAPAVDLSSLEDLRRASEQGVLSPSSLDKYSRSSLPSQPPPESASTSNTNTNTNITAGSSNSNGPPPTDVWDAAFDNVAPGLQYPTQLTPEAISALTTTGLPIGCPSPGGTIPGPGQPPIGDLSASGEGRTPLSDVVFADNGLLYVAEDLPGFGMWGNS
ncbi:hypothetical protein ASPZODRAFT_159794 [Penicilliopsis zonata CBS 506.65]|uniref:Zn(2)-C6 fungal-type domain-containing protein n=1 Tax=Penicilliopsis zonata CBS 506.65 TaxID=1073090 RepID=A0A1L9SGG8_9EURO|nr:hypothetical protein ASPZODRAFT_159794 [Penicilliopsis zonata CBS 506.65]OJJ46256.1 hypothetical protein ASPZODRAFT_159794 [Penicilliopsis zonata CBS 506.65]